MERSSSHYLESIDGSALRKGEIEKERDGSQFIRHNKYSLYDVEVRERERTPGSY